jgi:hypothetical protein
VGADDDIADIDADTELNPAAFRVIDRQLEDAVLELHSRSYCIDGAREFGQKPVPRVLDNAATMGGDRRQDHFRQQRRHASMRRFLIHMHQARIADDIRHQYRRQTPFDAFAGEKAAGIRIVHPFISDPLPGM